MPTIEIASINATNLGLTQCDFKVAIIEEDTLRSHRGLFYDDHLQYQGSIVHIGNPDFKTDKDGGFFAGMLINWDVDGTEDIIIPFDSDDTDTDQQYILKFLEDFKTDIDLLLRSALEKSPIKRVFFLTDYQFGPSKAQKEIIYTISDFWTLHDNDGLRFNTLYEMYGP
jgi:hypothetical protein